MISFESTGKPIAKHYKLALPNTRRMNEDNNSLCDAIQVSARPISQTKPCPNCSRLLPRSDVDFLVRLVTCDVIFYCAGYPLIMHVVHRCRSSQL